MPVVLLSLLVTLGVIPAWLVPFIPLIEAAAPVGELLIVDLIKILQNTNQGHEFVTALRTFMQNEAKNPVYNIPQDTATALDE